MSAHHLHWPDGELWFRRYNGHRAYRNYLRTLEVTKPPGTLQALKLERERQKLEKAKNAAIAARLDCTRLTQKAVVTDVRYLMRRGYTEDQAVELVSKAFLTARDVYKHIIMGLGDQP